MSAYPGAAQVDGVPAAWYPVDHNFLSWSFEPVLAVGTFTLTTAGTVYLAQVKSLGRPITNIVYDITTAGGTLTANQCLVGVYQNGALLGSSADQAAAWASTGVKTTALTAPVNTLEGGLYVAFVFNGTTGPTLATGGTTPPAGLPNAGLTGPTARYGSANTGVTTVLPATLSAITALSQSPWVATS